MKCIRLFALALLFVSTGLAGAVETNGFLVFEVGRLVYSGTTNKSEIRQRFKVPLTEEFLSKFKQLPNQHSNGTAFWCGGGNLKASRGSTRFAWWIRRTADNRWSINMWGDGVETLNGVTMSSRNPKTSQNLVIRKWEDLDMSYMLSYNAGFNPPGENMNISFAVKYLTAKDIEAAGPIPSAPVQRADQSELFKGDDLDSLPLEIRCGFQD